MYTLVSDHLNKIVTGWNYFIQDINSSLNGKPVFIAISPISLRDNYYV